MKQLRLALVLCTVGLLSSCNLSQIPGLDDHLSIEDSKAIGAACRHAGRALEDCFKLNEKAQQAGVFEGWREMNDYMMTNNLAVVKPEIEPSAFTQSADDKHEKGSKDDAAHEKKSSKAAEPEENLPTPKERWSPSASPSPRKESSDSASSTSGGKSGSSAETDKNLPSNSSEPEKPVRPWERGKSSEAKDPKSHT